MMKMKRQRRTKNPIQHTDNISQLPEPILHHILSFLPTIDATKTSILSKTWYSTWKSFPVLSFSQHSFEQYAFTKATFPLRFNKVIQDFIDFVDNSINRLNGDLSVQKFELQVTSKGFKRKNGKITIDRWINHAINKNVEDLDLTYYMKPSIKDDNQHYIVPQSVFRSQSLKNLNLFGCQFITSGLHGTGIGLSLRKLSLTHVNIDQNTLQSVVSNSSCLLEELTIEHCKGFDVIKISGLSTLKTVELCLAQGKPQIIALEAPNLRSISYGGEFDNVKGSIVGSRFEKIKEILLHDVWIQESEFFGVISEFSSLEKMELKRCSLLGNSIIKIPSNIRLLEVSICDCFKLKDIDLDTSRLRCFKVYSSYMS